MDDTTDPLAALIASATFDHYALERADRVVFPAGPLQAAVAAAKDDTMRVMDKLEMLEDAHFVEGERLTRLNPSAAITSEWARKSLVLASLRTHLEVCPAESSRFRRRHLTAVAD